MYYVVKFEGHIVRGDFHDYDSAEKWAERHCRGEFEVRKLVETHMPRAMKLEWKPNMDMPDLRHKPFMSVKA